MELLLLPLSLMGNLFIILPLAALVPAAMFGWLYYRYRTWTGLLSAFVLWPVYNDRQGDTFVPFGVAAFGLLLLWAFHPAFTDIDRSSLVSSFQS